MIGNPNKLKVTENNDQNKKRLKNTKGVIGSRKPKDIENTIAKSDRTKGSTKHYTEI